MLLAIWVADSLYGVVVPGTTLVVHFRSLETWHKRSLVPFFKRCQSLRGVDMEEKKSQVKATVQGTVMKTIWGEFWIIITAGYQN